MAYLSSRPLVVYDVTMTNKTQENAPFRLSKKAFDELVEALKVDIGEEAVNELGVDNIHHIGQHLLTLTAIQLCIRIKEKKREQLDSH